jgi:hypothetical protein
MPPLRVRRWSCADDDRLVDAVVSPLPAPRRRIRVADLLP